MSQALLFIRNNMYLPVERGWVGLWSLIGWLIQQLVFAIIVVVAHALVAIRDVYRVVDRVILFVEKTILVVGLWVMSLAVFVVAVDRWLDVINLGWFWATKLALFLMIWVGFIGASVAVKERKHLTIDVASRALGPRGGRMAAFFANIASAAFCLVLLKPSIAYVQEAFKFGDVEGVFPVPLWIVELVIPFSLLVMAARFVENIFREPVDVELLRAEGKRPGPRASMGLARDPMAAKDVIIAGLLPGFLLGAVAVFYFNASPGWLTLVACILLLVIGAPLFVLIGVATLLAVGVMGNGELVSVTEDMFGAVKKEVLLAIPFFILSGAIMTAGSIATRLIGFARSLVAGIPGGMLAATVVACVLFGAISGSAPVTVIAIGGIMLPALVKERYSEDLSIGLVTTAGAIGILIPPSIPLIIYAIMAPVEGHALSIRDLFIAGVLPGLLVAVVLATYAIFKLPDERFRNHEHFSLSGIGRAFKDGVFSVLLILLIFVGIYFGFFTVVEAAAVSVIYAVLVELVLQPTLNLLSAPAGERKRFGDYIEFKPRDMPRTFIDSSVMMGSIFLILVLAMALNRFLTEEQIPDAATAWISGFISSKLSFLIIMNLFLLVLGCLMDIMSAIMIVAPLLAPIAIHYGIDPIHFGIIFVVNLSIGYITPPIGLSLFVASSVFNKPLTQVIRASFPYTVIMLVALVGVTYVPAFSLFLLGDASAPQSEACQQYVACQKAVDQKRGSATPDLDARFGPEAECWERPFFTSKATAACTEALEELRDDDELHPLPAVCGGDGDEDEAGDDSEDAVDAAPATDDVQPAPGVPAPDKGAHADASAPPEPIDDSETAGEAAADTP
ncbi:MAG: TRAP transporter large permease subunit [Pseudomonadota bacterium]